MTTSAATLHFHHYDRSPFSEKVRVAFGLKALRWASVIQPRWAPKPALEPLTGGYRRTPVLQIGADIYCDTRCILDELDRRFPSPPLHPPGSEGVADAIAAWADRDVFADALGLVFGTNAQGFPAELHADRKRLMAGRFDGWNAEAMRAQLPLLRNRLVLHLERLSAMLADGRDWLCGAAPSVADLAAWHPVWYLRENLPDAIEWSRWPALRGWMQRLDAIGRGERCESTPEAALQAAGESRPLAPPPGGSDEAADSGQWAGAGLHSMIGAVVTVSADDWGLDPVTGRLQAVGRNRVSIRRADPRLGELAVHFPLTGFAVRRVPAADLGRQAEDPGSQA